MKRQPVSVVIPTYNGQNLLAKHLPAVAKVLQAGDEVVIADDASTDTTIEWLKDQVPLWQKKSLSLRWVSHKKNQRFAATVNSGVEAAKYRFVFLLNNDVSPLSHYIVDRLQRWFRDPEMFAVGCAEVTTDLADARVSGRGTGAFRRGLAVHWYDPNQSLHNTLWAAGGSLMIDREKFQAIGGMDTLFYPAYEEDRDLSYRALKHGWKVLFDPQARVLHQHESTNASVFGQRRMQIDSWKNQYLFVWKNITDPVLLLQHVLWLPYHLTISAQRSDGAAWQGFWKAVRQLPAALKQRQAVGSLWKRSDQAVFTQAATPVPSFSS